MTPDEHARALLRRLKKDPSSTVLKAQICSLLATCTAETRYEFNLYGLHTGSTRPLLLVI